MPRPVVGVSACVREMNTVLNYHAANARYMDAVHDVSGAMPVIIPAMGDRMEHAELLSRLDGLVLTGSPSNVEPHHYDTPRAAPDIKHDPLRDATTLPLIRLAVSQGVPVFAVCRGIQELNVALGGSLHQFVHLLPGKRDHRSDKAVPLEKKIALAHWVTLTPGGVLAKLTGADRVMVNSLHAQACDRVAPILMVEAFSDDGIVEAVSAPTAAGYVLGVQWHPEALYGSDRLSNDLFGLFGEAVHAHARGEKRQAA
jgi:putative glutamine amidotransferase